jgi:DNA-binding response OmpR family regulator
MPTILFAEDSLVQAKLAIHHLSEAGFDVKHYTSAEDALQALEDGLKPDMILSDVIMGDMNGYDFCRRAKADDRWKAIPFMMLTGQEALEDQWEGTDAGANDYVVKPFNGPDMLGRVKLLLAGSGPGVDDDYISSGRYMDKPDVE